MDLSGPGLFCFFLFISEFFSFTLTLVNIEILSPFNWF